MAFDNSQISDNFNPRSREGSDASVQSRIEDQTIFQSALP